MIFFQLVRIYKFFPDASIALGRYAVARTDSWFVTLSPSRFVKVEALNTRGNWHEAAVRAYMRGGNIALARHNEGVSVELERFGPSYVSEVTQSIRELAAADPMNFILACSINHEGKLVIEDGGHRLAMLKEKGCKETRIFFVAKRSSFLDFLLDPASKPVAAPLAWCAHKLFGKAFGPAKHSR